MSTAFPAILPNGKRQVLVALPSDTVGPLIRRAKSFGGPVNLAVASDDFKQIDVIVFHVTANRALVTESQECSVTKTTEMGMLVALLRSTGKPARLRFVQPNFEAELIDADGRVPV